MDQFEHVLRNGGKHYPDGRIDRDVRDDESQDSRRYREKNALAEKLADQASAEGTEREADADLALPCGGTSEHHAGDVRARQSSDEAENDCQRAKRDQQFGRQRNRGCLRMPQNSNGFALVGQL
jgi:hypothetical protein